MSIREEPNAKRHDEAIFNQTRPAVTLLAILAVFMVFLFPAVAPIAQSQKGKLIEFCARTKKSA